MKKIENIFIWTSIIFLIGIVGFFSYRFIHYYRLSHNRDVISNDLYEIILDNRAILNLRKVDNSYYYTENNGNNYVIYSGILWRIIKLENNKLTLISDVPVTNLYYDDVLDYLNNEFYNLLDNRLIVDTETCINSDEKNECIEKYTNKVLLLSLDNYDIVGGINSYINNGYFTYLMSNLYVNDSGKISDINGNDLYGIKPVITINSTDILNGSGTKNNPYILDRAVTNLKDALIGSYVSFSNKTFRIMENNDYAKLILDDVIPYELSISKYENSNLYNYLNDNFYNSLDMDNLITSGWYSGHFDNDYSDIQKEKINCNVVIANIGDMFINDQNNYILMSTPRLLETMYVIKNNGIIYEENNLKDFGVRPVFKIKNDLKITGDGTKNSPYIVGENNEDKN